MRKRFGGIGLALVLSLGMALPAEGQVAWDSPQLISPATPGGLGLYLVEAHPGDGLGVLMTWRGSDGPGGVGFRLGIAEGRGEDLSVFGGVDFSGLFYPHSNEFPLDVLWASGVGVGVGDFAILSVPFGVVLGRSLDADGVTFTPYFSPRLFLDAFLGDDNDNRDNLDLGFAMDIGADVSFGGSFDLRFAASLGDRETLAIGAVFPIF